MSRKAPESCAICGGDIPPKAHACPHCGADERTGWREQDVYDGLDLPGNEEDETTPKVRGAFSPMVASIIGLVLVLVLIRLLF